MKKHLNFLICLLLPVNDQAILKKRIDRLLDDRRGNNEVLLFPLNENAQIVSDIAVKLKKTGIKIRTAPALSGKTNPLFHVITYILGNCPDYDILISHIDVDLPLAWDVRLSWAAYEDAKVASLSPMCNNLSLFTLCLENHSFEIDLEKLNRFANSFGEHRNYDAPVFLNRCVYFRRDALNAISLYLNNFDRNKQSRFEWHLSKLFLNNGYINALCDHIYVFDNQNKNNTHEWIEEDLETKTFKLAHPLTGLRYRIADAVANKESSQPIPGIEDKPVRLHVMHSWGGGLGQWVEQYAQSDQNCVNLILKSIGTWGAFGQRLILFEEVRQSEPKYVWDFSRPIRATAIGHLEYGRILKEIIMQYGVDTIIVSSLIGHSLEILDTDVKTFIVCHDYYPICSAINIYFNGICESCEENHLKDCIEKNELNRFFRNVSCANWVSIRDRYTELILKRAHTLIIPTKSVEHHLKKLDSRLESAKFCYIPHGTTLINRYPRLQNIQKRKKIRILILGDLSLHKGVNLFRNTYQRLMKFAEIYLVGCGENGKLFADKKGIKVINNYERMDLGRIVNEIAPDVGLLLSIWPETFSYTLTELWQLGVPPVATNLGGFADRIEDEVNGFLFEPKPEALMSCLRNLSNRPDLLKQVQLNLTEQKHRTTEEMIKDYDDLAFDPEYGALRYKNKKQYGKEFANNDTLSLTDGYGHEQGFVSFLKRSSDFVLCQAEHSPRLKPWQKRIAVKILKASANIMRWL